MLTELSEQDSVLGFILFTNQLFAELSDNDPVESSIEFDGGDRRNTHSQMIANKGQSILPSSLPYYITEISFITFYQIGWDSCWHQNPV